MATRDPSNIPDKDARLEWRFWQSDSGLFGIGVSIVILIAIVVGLVGLSALVFSLLGLGFWFGIVVGILFVPLGGIGIGRLLAGPQPPRTYPLSGWTDEQYYESLGHERYGNPHAYFPKDE